MKKFIVSEDTEVSLNDQKFLLEKGDKIMVEMPGDMLPQEAPQEAPPWIDSDDLHEFKALKMKYPNLVFELEDTAIWIKGNSDDVLAVIDNIKNMANTGIMDESSGPGVHFIDFA